MIQSLDSHVIAIIEDTVQTVLIGAVESGSSLFVISFAFFEALSHSRISKATFKSVYSKVTVITQYITFFTAVLLMFQQFPDHSKGVMLWGELNVNVLKNLTEAEKVSFSLLGNFFKK